MTELMTVVPILFVGIDWGSVEHRVVVLDAAGKVLSEWSSKHTGEALRELCDRLVSLAGGAVSACRVAIEVKHGPVVETLLERGFDVYAVNPKQTDRFRDRYMPSGAKDDRRDGLVLASAVRTDAEHLIRLGASERRTVSLRAALRLRQELIEDRVRLLLRLREQLWRYYAQMLELADGDLDAPWLWELWEKAPAPTSLSKLKRPHIERILKSHRIRRIDANQVMATLRKPSLVVADGVSDAAARHIRSIIPRLRLLTSQLRDADRDIAEQLDAWTERDDGTSEATHHNDDDDEPRLTDVEILRSLPGVGPIVLANLLTELGDVMSRGDYAAARLLTGVAPITRQSGGSHVVSMRRTTSETIRSVMFHWARSAVICDPRCKQRYAALRARGVPHARAYRTVADGLLRIACAMLRRRTAYQARPPAEAA